MRDLNGHGRPVGLGLGQRAVALTMVASAFVACSSGGTPGGGTEPTGVVSSSSSARGSTNGPTSSAVDPKAGDGRTIAPETPAKHAKSLASQLEDASTTLQDPDAPAADVRRAGELQQLAVRSLASSPRAFRAKVMDNLLPETARVTRASVVAARVLGGITTPQRTLPRWRIVAPPPPGELLGHYRDAGRRTGVPWRYLAAIHLVETRMGRIRGASTAGALGPMQFLPSTWALYGAGGDINDPRDAIFAAARLLRANGAPRDMAGALFHYNPSDSYVRAVSEYARTLQRAEWAYLGYWHWRVLYRHARGTYVLPVGYPKKRPVLLREN